MRRKFIAVVVLGLLTSAVLLGDTAIAQCCGTSAYTVGYQPVTAYQPVAYQAYQPVAYQVYQPYTGWYPGYWLNRWFGRRTYTAASTPTYAYTASYTPTYTASYAGYTAAYPVATTAYYGSSCSSCGCQSCCGTQSVVMRPVTCCNACSSCGCDPCSCGSCESTSVTPAVYESDSSCPTCAAPASYATPLYENSPSNTRSTVPSTFDQTPQPEIAPDEMATPRQSLRPVAPSTYPADPKDYDSGNGNFGSPSSYFEAPKLFDPNDRMTQRAGTPVWTAVHHRPVDSRPVAQTISTRTRSVDRAAAERDARGWTAAN